MNKVTVIAEIANAHQGQPDIAIELAKAAAEAGADVVKFQVYFANELLTTTHPRYEHFRNQAFSPETWDEIFSSLKDLKCDVFADVFGVEALGVALRNDIDGFKVHSSDLTNTPLLRQLSEQDKPVLLATGGSTVLEIIHALNILGELNLPREIVLMHGFQAYPTPVEENVLSRLEKFRELFGESVSFGFMDHTTPDDIFSVVLPLMSLTYGVRYIEKHLTFDRWRKGVDYYSSLEPNEFAEFVANVGFAQKAIGDDPLVFSSSERKYREQVKKSWVTNAAKSAGDSLGSSDLIMCRTPKPATPIFYEEVVGSALTRDLAKEQVVSRADFKHKVLAIVVARSASSRLPGKALMEINGKPSLAHLFERVALAKRMGFVDTIAFCTTTENEDRKLVEVAQGYPVKVYRGPVEDVLGRMSLALNDNPDHDVVLRITGDDILIDPDYLHKTVKQHLDANADYTDAKGLPSGTEVEVFSAYTMRLLQQLSSDSKGSEYLTNYILDNRDQFNISSLVVPSEHRKNYRLTIDTRADFELVSRVLVHMKENGKEFNYSVDDIVQYLDANPELSKFNQAVEQRRAPLTVNTYMDWRALTRPPLVTVYIVNHNYGRYVEKAISSALNQKFRDFELIIIDDGSTDNSRELLSKYLHHARTKVVFQENRGLNTTNNIALNLAKGKYLIRLDADDYLDENALAVMANTLEGDPKLALVFPDYYLVDENDEVIKVERRHDFSQVGLFDQPCHGACTMIRTEVLREVGGYSEEYTCQDGYDLWLKVIDRYQVDNINLPLFYYRKHEQSLTTNSTKILETRAKIIDKHAQKYDVRGKNHVCIIPIRGGDSNQPLALRKFANSTLLEMAIRTALNAKNITHVIVTCPDRRIAEAARKKFGDEILVDPRPEDLAALNTHIENTVDYLLEGYRARIGLPDTISICNFEYPLRRSDSLDKAINAMYSFGADSVISVTQESANYYQHHGNGLVPFSQNAELNLERNFIYKEAGGIHAVKYDAYKKHGKLTCGKVTHIVMDELSAIRVDKSLNFEYAEYFRKLRPGT